MFSRLLSNMSMPTDVLYLTIMSICLETNAVGGFIATEGLEYFDVIVGSIREKRRGGDKDAIGMFDLKNINKTNIGYIKNKIAVYHSSLDWYIGIDDPLIKEKENIVKDICERNVLIAYPVYCLLLKYESKNDERDLLTGALTKKRFYKDIEAHIKTAIKTGIKLNIFYIDFNNFKIINDILGHKMGDAVIRSISSEISNVFLGYGNLYRVGGDEFIGVALGLDNEQINILSKRLERVSEQAPCGLFVNLSVGIKKFNQDEYNYSAEQYNINPSRFFYFFAFSILIRFIYRERKGQHGSS